MDSNIKFSILVPVYKVEEYLHQCIDSVLGQSYSNFELILVDDGSPDKCGDICEEYAAKDGRIRVFHKPNGGLMSTRRYALERACGDYMVFLDSDDYLESSTLETLHGYIRRYDADCIIYGINWRKPGGTEYIVCSEAYQNRLITDKRELLNLVLNDNSYNSLCRKCVRASCFDGRDMSAYFHISHGEDRLQSEEILENASSFLFIPETLYNYRVNASSITHSENFDSYKADFTVEDSSIALAKKLGVFSAEDFDRHRNFELDALVITLKKISRWCSDMDNSIAGFKSVKESEYYKNFLSVGYKKVPAMPGIVESSGLRRLFNKTAVALMRLGAYRALVYFNKYVYR